MIARPRLRLSRPRGVRAAALAVLALALVLAGLSGYRVTVAPFDITPRHSGFGVAESSMLVDTAQSSLLDTEADALGANSFTLTYALFIQTDGPKAEIEQRARIPLGSLESSGPFTDLLPRPNIVRRLDVPQPDKGTSRYRLVLDLADGRPVLSFYAQAPTAAEAARIVDAAKAVLLRHVRQRQRAAPPALEDRSTLRELGPTTSGTLADDAGWQVIGIMFFSVLAAGGLIVYLLERHRRMRASGARRVAQPSGTDLSDLDDSDCWPHTRRPLPWAIAVFLGMIFLLPFDQISLPIPIPLDGKLDRPLLLALTAAWMLAFLHPNPAARPQIRLTRVHVAGLVFFAIASLSAVVNAPALVNLQEFTLVLKKLALLASFLLFFVIVASSVRPTEVPRFVKLMLGMAMIAAIGAILEYRLRFNPFYTWTAKLLPGSVEVPGDLYGVDSIGRLTVYGPTGHPLELATMLSALVPFALLGLSEAKERRQKIVYSIALALLLAGALSTVRKTSVLAPIPGILVLLAYRPRRIFSRQMLPVVLVMGIAVHFVAPGTLGSLYSQLSPSKLGNVRSSQDRANDYDGVRPDVMSHLLFGRGYQSYDPHKYRILDNEYLFLIIGVGLVGLLAYLAILGGALSSAHRPIRGPDPIRARYALGGAGAVAVVGAATALFDVLSFPHVPYLLFFMAAMLVVLREPSPAASPPVRMPLPLRPIKVVAVPRRVAERVGSVSD